MIKLPDEKDTIRIATCLGLFSSVIKSGKPWTETCHRHYEDALSAIERLNATAQTVSDEHARIADALESLLWPNMAISNKAIILCAIKALRGIPAAPGGQDI